MKTTPPNTVKSLPLPTSLVKMAAGNNSRISTKQEKSALDDDTNDSDSNFCGIGKIISELPEAIYATDAATTDSNINTALPSATTISTPIAANAEHTMAQSGIQDDAPKSPRTDSEVTALSYLASIFNYRVWRINGFSRIQ